MYITITRYCLTNIHFRLESSIATTSNSSIGLAFNVDVDFTFFLIESEIGEVHKEYAGNYKNVILSRAEEVSAYNFCASDS